MKQPVGLQQKPADGAPALRLFSFGRAGEREFDGLAEKTEDGFLLLFLSTQGLDDAAALRAQLQQLAAAPANTVHALVAHHLAAIGALVSHHGLGMARAK